MILIAWAFTANAQIKKGAALFEQLTTETGLSSNQVNCIFQDSRGFIWIGTGSGLNRYDGLETVHYFHSKDKNSLAGNIVNSIREDKNQHLWIGTNAGISYFEPEKNRFTNYLNTTADFEKLGSHQFYVGSDKDSNLWVSSSFYLSSFDKQQNKFTHYKIDNGQNLPVTRNHFTRSVFEDSKNRLWVPTSFGVQLFNRSTGIFSNFRFPEKNKVSPENSVVAVTETTGGKIVAATWGGSILLFNEISKRFEKIILFEEPLPHQNLINIIMDLLPVQDRLYCATSEGLVILDETDLVPGVCRRFTIHAHIENNNKSISSNFTNALLTDRDGTLWVAAKGISKMDRSKQQFTNYPLSYNNIPFSVSSACISNNSLVLAANDAYFFNNGLLLPFGLRQKIKSSFGEQIWDIHTGKNALWLATTNGLIETSKTGRFVKQYLHQPNNTASLAGERVWKVHEDSHGLVWIGTVRRGISILNPATGNIQNHFCDKDAKNSLFNKYVSDFYEDRQSNIWFTAGGGWLYCYNRSQSSFSVTRLKTANSTEIESECTILNEMPGNILSIVSRQGLLLYNTITQKTTVAANDMAFENAGAAINTGSSQYWLVTSNGLLHYNAANNKFKRFTTRNGLPSDEDINTIMQLPDGRVLLGGTGFISFFDPLQTGNNQKVPPVYITKILANSKDTLFESNGKALPYLSGIEFHFAALDFSNAAQSMYQYRLVGIDANWSQPTSQRSISYAQLPPGRYRFEVKGSNADGAWNEIPAVFSFTINRPFYKSWWFYVLLVAVAALLLYALYRYRLQKAIELEKMRTRIATDLHDDIGATLSSISMYSDALKNQVKEKLPHLEPVLNKMGESSREMVTGMSDIVWAINPENDSGQKMVSRMETYATDICAAKNIRLHFTCDEKIVQQVLPLEIRKNVYLVFKEAVNNAVKYSEAGNLWVSIYYDNGVTLLVRDDGKGFDETLIRPGNGLKNLQVRAREIGGELHLQSAPGSGTIIRLSCML